MELMRNWLGPLIEQSLERALVSNENYEADTLLGRVKFDVGTLYIRIEDMYYLQVTEYSCIEDSVNATLSDSYSTIGAAFSFRSLQCENLQPKVAANTLSIGAVLQLQEFEIRVTDCFDPPRLSLSIDQFRLHNTQPTRIFGCPSKVTEEAGIKRLLRLFSSMTETSEGQEEPVEDRAISPICSQAGWQGSDEENKDLDLASQLNLATQAPLPAQNVQRQSMEKGANASKNLLSLLGNHRPLEQIADNRVKVKKQLEPAEYKDPVQRSSIIRASGGLTVRKHCGDSLQPKAAHSEPLQSSSPGTHRVFQTQQPVVVSGEEEGEEIALEDCESVRDHPEPSAASNPKPLLEEDKMKKEHDTCEPRFKDKEVSATAGSRPVDPWWRQKGRKRLSHLATTIPKDQQRMQDANSLDDCWDPPLPGKRLAHPHIPIKLLEKLNSFHEAKAFSSDEIALDRKDLRPQDEGLHSKLETKHNQGPFLMEKAEDGSSETSEELVSDWSSSPPRPPRLPPNSSPPGRISSRQAIPPSRERTNVSNSVSEEATAKSATLLSHPGQRVNCGHGDADAPAPATSKAMAQPVIPRGNTPSPLNKCPDRQSLEQQKSGTIFPEYLGGSFEPYQTVHASIAGEEMATVVNLDTSEDGSELEISLLEDPEQQVRALQSPAKSSGHSSPISTSPRLAQSVSTVQVKWTPLNGSNAPRSPHDINRPPRPSVFSHSSELRDKYLPDHSVTATSSSIVPGTLHTSRGPDNDVSSLERHLNHPADYRISDLGPSERDIYDAGDDQVQTLASQQGRSELKAASSPMSSPRSMDRSGNQPQHSSAELVTDDLSVAEGHGEPATIEVTVTQTPRKRKAENDHQIFVNNDERQKPSKRPARDVNHVEVAPLARQLAIQARRAYFVSKGSANPSIRSLSSPPEAKHSSVVPDQCSHSSRPPRPSSSKNQRQVSTPPTSTSSPQNFPLKGSRRFSPQFQRGKSSDQQISLQNRRMEEITAENLFDTFRQEYPFYDGNFEQFVKVCRLIRNLQVQGRALHRSLWDDFIVNYYLHYLPYGVRCLQNCETAVSYETFYNEEIEDPACMKRIVNPTTLSRIVARVEVFQQPPPDLTSPTSISLPGPVSGLNIERDPSDRDSRDGSFGRPSIHSAEAPAPLILRTHFSQLKEEDGDQFESQSSSLHRWLQKSAGAPSPELGTPDDEYASQPHASLPAVPYPSLNGLRKPSPAPEIRSEVSLIDLDEDLADSPEEEREEKEITPQWWHDANTPFKDFARSYTSLKSEDLVRPKALRRHLNKEGVLKPFSKKGPVSVGNWRNFG